MTDQTSQGEAADGAEWPPGGKPWPRTKALTILIAAWSVLGLLTVAVQLGGAAVAELLAEGLTDGHRLLIYWGIFFFALVMSAFAVPLLWSTTGPTPRDNEDHGLTDITPPAVSIPGVLLPAAICLLGEWLQLWSDSPPTHVMALAMMLIFQHLLINKRLGPLIRSLSPELWAEAVHRRQWRRRQEMKDDDDPVFAFFILSVLLIYLFVA